MIVSLKWLRDYVDFSLSTEELANRLTMAGLEVEGIHRPYSFMERVITVRLEAVEPHPRADRLSLCTVTDGRKTYRVVCGAPNLEEGSIVPLALAGAELPSGVTLSETQIRGEVSQGMLCSQKELGLGEDASGIWLLPPGTPVGVFLSQALGIEDELLEVSITPNRGDCLSIVGIAREVSAQCGSPLRYPDFSIRETGPSVESLTSVTVDDVIGCPRYAARVVRGITVGPTPAWLRARLEAVGLRSINNIVDVTNYILMEMGQPLHAFDYDRLRQNRIVVRRASAGERFTTLDGVERSLFDDSLLICDGEGPVAIAGIMGGLNSEIEEGTTQVLIESAYFQQQCIRRTSKKLGLRTESSYRFERGVDPEGLIRALDRAAQLMAELGGGEVATGRIDVYPNPIESPTLTLRVERVNRFLATQLKPSDMAEVLQRIEMRIEQQNGGDLKVVPPSFRPDITREVDLAEEVARLVGYDHIPVTSPKTGAQAASLDPHQKARRDLKSVLQGAGFYEVLTYSFIPLESLKKLRLPAEDPRLHPIPLRNPLSEDQGVMRTTLIPGLLQTVRYNLDRNNEDLRLFELSKVFLPADGAELPREPHHLAGMVSGRRYPNLLYGGREDVDYTDVKGVVENVLAFFNLDGVRFEAKDVLPYLNPVCAASLYCDGERIGVVGQLHFEVQEAFDLKQTVYVFELDFDRTYEIRRPQAAFRQLPKYPSVVRDLAIVVDSSVSVREPLDFILHQEESLLEEVDIFDIYKDPQLGDGKISYGYRMVYRALDRSLTDEEVNVLHGRLVEKVLNAFQATLR